VVPMKAAPAAIIFMKERRQTMSASILCRL
jgi:hypothetical protein